ncbi:inositol 1,4,5-trisphosphate receptor-interacting protein-like 1 [Catharus ustulatus]|uniref:inositol 1,4,5-trisphosphate receptor-interacting protein-like 1 n=1 Tax=Catharus ustulatus TaxID=91951 RepID=UPI001C5BE3E2|nr:inositol 1,4,5-trisphosphate receptor-interacting protein-like 1 [Catharus ustulatus]
MKASNSDNVNEGEDNVDGKEEHRDVKEQESSDASEQRNSDWTGQEDSSSHGHEVDHSGVAAAEKENKEVTKEVESDRNKDRVNVEGNKNEDKEEDEEDNVAARENEGSDGGKEESTSGGIQDREGTRDAGNKQGILLFDRIEWPVEDLERGCSETAELMESFTRVFVDSVSDSFYPVPQEAIGVGSAFEGWSPGDWDGVYRVLVPLNPPPGHSFHLELNSTGQVAARTFNVRVELVCMCQREQLGEKLLCLLHHSQEELQHKQERSLLETLCTGSYLDVEKTSRWFCDLVRCSWLHVPQSYSWHLVFQRCSRSCRFELSRGRKSLMVEMLFGVRQWDSDIFVVSQTTEAQKGGSSIFVSSQSTEARFPASTAWVETSAVAEVKFFWYIARQVPCESLHLKCLQVFTRILRGTGFSSSTWKTVVMHVLTTVPLSRWSRREFARQLWDIMAYLRRCLKSKRLEHFVLGNKRLPEVISVPPAMRGVEPPNLFEHLARDPAAHREAMKAYGQLRFRLWVLLSSR